MLVVHKQLTSSGSWLQDHSPQSRAEVFSWAYLGCKVRFFVEKDVESAFVLSTGSLECHVRCLDAQPPVLNYTQKFQKMLKTPFPGQMDTHNHTYTLYSRPLQRLEAKYDEERRRCMTELESVRKVSISRPANKSSLCCIVKRLSWCSLSLGSILHLCAAKRSPTHAVRLCLWAFLSHVLRNLSKYLIPCSPVYSPCI